ncbi:hypothetical protein F443_12070 [Phytophthora nicotianae P1569]|uniref:RxLR effector protein n=1 Tax=Phytophthora nicotianae P1569 TaxID=1317065 RepID=V9EWN6_PHYNI|nr:hypothetical protein F443_12070 [Phytophthora nicotianae P1569]
MRAYFVLLIAATALLTKGEATSGFSHLAVADVMKSTGVVETYDNRRSLRAAEPTEDDNGEERAAWSNIKGIPRNKAETVADWLTPRLQSRMNVQQFARDVDITSRQAATQHENWNALVKYLRMYHLEVKGEAMSKKLAESILLHNVLTKTNGF